MGFPSNRENEEEDAAAVDALSATEQHVLQSLQQWGELLTSTNKNAHRGRKSKRSRKQPKVDLNEAALHLIDHTTTTLAELRSALQGSANNVQNIKD
jgi:hypothetical protein